MKVLNILRSAFFGIAVTCFMVLMSWAGGSLKLAPQQEPYITIITAGAWFGGAFFFFFNQVYKDERRMRQKKYPQQKNFFN